MTAALVAASVLTRAADEDDAIDDARPLAEDAADRLVYDLEQLAASDGVSPEDAERFADIYVGLIRLAAVEAAQPVLSGVLERAHGGLTAGEARRLERVTRKAIDDHRAERRARASTDRKSEPPGSSA